MASLEELFADQALRIALLQAENSDLRANAVKDTRRSCAAAERRKYWQKRALDAEQTLATMIDHMGVTP